MIRHKKFKMMGFGGGGFLSRADRLYDARKRMRDSLFIDTRGTGFPETPAEWMESRSREKDPTNIYDSME